ncbi:MAG: GTPase domain-containing protein [Burkholderiaceae bacterium]
MNTTPTTISISLVSHTNAGKTTLARTLLGRDIGAVRDEAHVTDTAESHELVRTAQGDSLLLWDTPGFGDSLRLARRLEAADNPLGWLVGQVWDRLRDRPLWSSQQALRHVREQADVVLYLVNAAEDPQDAGYVEPEMRVLAWTGKPVMVLLNQMGPPRPAASEQAEVDRWQQHLAHWPQVRDVLALDAFARCWVQEDELLQRIGGLLDAGRQQAYERLRMQWQRQHHERYRQAIACLAADLAAAAADRVILADPGITGQLRDLGSSLGLPAGKGRNARDAAMVALGERWDEQSRKTTAALIQLHGLGGNATHEVMTRVDAHYAVNSKVNEGKAAILGGVATGALAGLKADLATGGFTLGGGMIVGSVLGALGAAGLAVGYNQIRGLDGLSIQWSDAVLLNKVGALTLTYLAVAHFGRGRGDWARAEYPAHWSDVVSRAVAAHKPQLLSALAKRAEAVGRRDRRKALATRLATVPGDVLRDVLSELYPQAVRQLP